MPPQGMKGTPNAAARRPAVRVAHACSSRRIWPVSTARRYQGARPKFPSIATMPARARARAPGAAEKVDVVAGRLFDELEVLPALTDQFADEGEGPAVQEAAADGQRAAVDHPGGKFLQRDDLRGSSTHVAPPDRTGSAAARPDASAGPRAGSSRQRGSCGSAPGKRGTLPVLDNRTARTRSVQC